MAVAVDDCGRQVALDWANEVRGEQKRIRARLRSGDVTLGELLACPPEAIYNVYLIDLIRWQYREMSPRTSVTEVGARAVRDKINLMLPFCRASRDTRTWVARNASHSWSTRHEP